jgi:hypothetical protein
MISQWPQDWPLPTLDGLNWEEKRTLICSEIFQDISCTYVHMYVYICMYYGEDFMNPFLEKVIISKCRYDLTRYDVTLPSDKCLDIYKDIENLINPSPD